MSVKSNTSPGLQEAGRHEVLHEQDRIDDLQRVGAARHRADLGVEEAVVPVDSDWVPKRLSGSSLSETKNASCWVPGMPPNLKRSQLCLING